ncbi:hypothetical protein LTR08_000096 [Meristemomyces frigidus]|nr:hypothetical protein LTR08_000096 [Meristemomyces frigidus]
MDKIKSLFRPGGDTDDNVMYGTPEPENTHANGGSADHEDVGSAMLQTDPASETGKDKGSGLKQMLNPGGDKNNSEQYETSAQSDRPGNTSATGTPRDATSSAQKMESLPGDEDTHASTYDSQQYSETSNALPGTTLSRMKEKGMNDSTMAIRSGMRGPYAGQAADGSMLDSEQRGTGSGAMLGGALPDRTGSSTISGVRSAALSDAPPNEPMQGYATQPRDDQIGNTSSGRSFPLSGGSRSASASDPSQRYGADEALRQDSSKASQSHLGRDAALGAGAGALGAGALAHESGSRSASSYNDPSSTRGAVGSDMPDTRGSGLGGSHGTSGGLSGADIPGDRTGYHHSDETPVDGYAHHTKGPHATDIANILDPHVPGEFPTESGEDPHQSHLGRDAAIGGGAGLGAAGLGAAGYEASQRHDEPSTIDPTSSSSLERSSQATGSTMPATSGTARDEMPTEGSSHHYGRDAALAGGAGVAGLGAYEATKSHRQTVPPTSAAETSKSFSAYTGGEGYPSQTTNASARDNPPTEQSQHHYGRDAALGGGAGATGLGAYEATKSHGQTVPSTSAAENSTNFPAYTGSEGYPSQSSMSTARDAFPTEQSQHHYGRDAALVGGTGAAGAGAYELSKDRTATGPSTSAAKTSTSSPAYTGNEGYPSQTTSARDTISTEQPQHHYGRDAALVGGTGAVGAGAYELSKDRTDTGPASKTIGPHDSNVANVLDPRVKPDPEKMKKSTASGPHKSDMANKAEPVKEHHYGRDAAVAGGAGTVGFGAYEATKDRSDENAAPLAQEQAATSHHEHNKLHKKNDPRGQQYAQYNDDKHEKDLQKAREHESAKGGDSGEKKEGFLHKLLHHGDKDKHADSKHEKSHVEAQHVTEPSAIGRGAETELDAGDESGVIIEPHTGLPMNVGKYGTTGGGGTDGAAQIQGYHETDPALQQAQHGTAETEHRHAPGEEGVAGPDWNKIKKGNTLY